MGAPAPPRGVKKFFRPNLQGKCESAPPCQSNSQFLGQFLLGGLDLEVYLDGLERATTKKRSSTFFGKKVHPQTKSWLRLCPLNCTYYSLWPLMRMHGNPLYFAQILSSFYNTAPLTSPHGTQPNFATCADVSQIWKRSSKIWGIFLPKTRGPKLPIF